VSQRTILIDCRFAPDATGLGRYTRELVTHLLKRQDPWKYVLLVSSEHENWLAPFLESRVSLCMTRARHYTFAEQMTLPSLIASVHPTIALFPHFNVPFWLNVPFVTTVHDLILHRFPNDASIWKRTAYRLLMRRTIRRSQSLIAVSRFTADEIARVYGERVRQKMHVVHQGVAQHFQRAPESDVRAMCEKYDIRRPYMFYVGNAKQHKNVQMLIDAHALIQDRFDLLLVTGGAEIHALRLHGGVCILSDVPDTDLPALYSGAHCMATASLNEGFCLPIAEALACGCPVVAVDSGPLREFKAPTESLSIVEPKADAIADAINDIQSPIPPFVFHSWQQTADETAAILRASIGDS
jgi:glycosyltransferase involved in cell wall biosynthesis